MINWAYLYQQLLMLLLSGAVATVGYGVLGLVRLPGRDAWWRRCLELPLLAGVLFSLGAHFGDTMSSGGLLPPALFPWTVGIGLAFYWMAVWWPLLILLRRSRIEVSRGRKLCVALAITMMLGAVYSVFVEPMFLEVDRRELVFQEVGAREIRVAHVSDTQLIALGPREKEVVSAINAFEPHLIIFSGDYIAGPHDEATEIAAMRWILSNLRASHGIFATTSDSDTERQRQLIFEDLPVTYLLNKSTTVDVEGVRVRVGGLNHLAPRWSRMAKGSQPDELFLVACHTPDHAEETDRLVPDADAYLCGHTHGGQVQVPFFGPLVTMTTAPRHVAAGGVFETTGGMPLLLSRGVGVEGDYAPRFRFWCRPHIFLLTLRGESPPPRR